MKQLLIIILIAFVSCKEKPIKNHPIPKVWIDGKWHVGVGTIQVPAGSYEIHGDSLIRIDTAIYTEYNRRICGGLDYVMYAEDYILIDNRDTTIVGFIPELPPIRRATKTFSDSPESIRKAIKRLSRSPHDSTQQIDSILIDQRYFFT
jgi:hypothetical protein